MSTFEGTRVDCFGCIALALLCVVIRKHHEMMRRILFKSPVASTITGANRAVCRVVRGMQIVWCAALTAALHAVVLC